MLDAIAQRLNRLVPHSRRDDPIARRKSLFLIGILMLVVATLPINILYQVLSQEWRLLFFSGFTFASFGALLALYPRRDIHRTASTFLLIWGLLGVFGTALLSGGLYSVVVPLTALLPLLSLALLDRDAGVLWGFITAAVLACFGAAESAGLTSMHDPAIFQKPLPVTMNLMLLLGLAGGFAWFTESLNKLREAQLVKERQLADDANAAKSAFLANMSHELRTPMNGVLGLTEVVLLDPHLPQQHRQHLQTVLSSGRALVDLLNDILDLSRVESGRLVLESIPWSPRNVAQDVQRLFGEVAREKGLTLTLDIAAHGLPSLVEGDPTRVRQVLSNLVGNAVKFTAEGTVRVVVRADAESLWFEVIDTGPGIAADVQARIFEPFTQADASMTRRYGGTGLGLSICRRLTHLMNGALELDSVPGEGSTFRVRLPLRVASTSRATEPAAEFGDAPHPAPTSPTPSADAQPKNLVLLVDDNEVSRMVAEQRLKQLDYEVESLADPEQALARILGGPAYTAVFLAMQMPGMTGPELTHLARLAGRQMPMVGLGGEPKTDAASVGDAGMNAILPAPFTAGQLKELLQDVLKP